MNSAMKALAAERAARNGSALADEACTQPAVAEDLKHGAIVYARHNTEAMADEEEG